MFTIKTMMASSLISTFMLFSPFVVVAQEKESAHGSNCPCWNNNDPQQARAAFDRFNDVPEGQWQRVHCSASDNEVNVIGRHLADSDQQVRMYMMVVGKENPATAAWNCSYADKDTKQTRVDITVAQGKNCLDLYKQVYAMGIKWCQ